MVHTQIEERGIWEPALLHAFRTVPREAFVSDDLAPAAYDDRPLPIGSSQTISQPYVVALMTASLELSPADRVLEIGTGSGYGAAVLSHLASEVYSMERHRELYEEAIDRLARLGYDRVVLRHGDGTLGWPERAPFDAIVVTAGGPQVPEALQEQLAIGGRLVMPVGAQWLWQDLLRLRRVGEHEYRREKLGTVRFVPLVGAQGHDTG